MTDEQQTLIMIGYIAARLGAPEDPTPAAMLVDIYPDRLYCHSPWTGRRFRLTVEILPDPPPPDWELGPKWDAPLPR